MNCVGRNRNLLFTRATTFVGATMVGGGPRFGGSGDLHHSYTTTAIARRPVSCLHGFSTATTRITSTCISVLSSSSLPLHMFSCRRYLASSGQNQKKKKKKGKGPKPRKLSKAEKKRRQRDKQQRQNEYRNEQKRKRRMNNLHPAAKMKRIISACDYWFSPANFSCDNFLQKEYHAFGGHVRVTTLASFPRLEGWTDANLVAQALGDVSVKKRHDVVHNRELIERGLRNEQRRELREERRAKEEAKLQQQLEKERRLESKARRKELEAYIDATRDAHAREMWQEDLREQAQYEAEEREKELAAMSTMERVADVARATAQTLRGAVTNGGEDANEKEEYDEDWYWLGGYEEELMERNEEFSEAVNELECINFEAESEWQGRQQDRDWDHFFERKFGHFERNQKKAKKKHDDLWGYSQIKIDTDDDLVDEELLSPVVDDGSNLVEYALVRPKKVIEPLLLPSGEHIDEYDGECDEYDEYDEYDVLDIDDELEPPKQSKKATNSRNKNLPKYKSERSVQVIRTPEQLSCFCVKLRESLSQPSSSSNDSASAIGFDVEYCTLEMDIRNTLPAMLQLASPKPNGPVGLIWLDKFPNFGRDVISNPDGAYTDLLSILGDSALLKVGVGASKDAKHLAHMWGITERDYAEYFIKGMRDLEEEAFYEYGREVINSKKSLQELCASVLGKDLPKLKERNAQAKKAQRKRGRRVKTSHWRRDDLTKDMKAYAADDASCSIDIWLQLQKEEEEATM